MRNRYSSMMIDDFLKNRCDGCLPAFFAFLAVGIELDVGDCADFSFPDEFAVGGFPGVGFGFDFYFSFLCH